MATFTDQIPQFNPYIQQLPVEAMVQVGMEKQKRYDEGLQKIQAQIEKVAGLDVIRDVDKAYLKSKLGELGNRLKTVAAGDFSNFQLVNSVSGMTGQIAKDPDIQNAVSSTAWYRKQLAEMEKAISEGKSSVENIYNFNKKSSDWISSTDLKRTFNGRYTQYIDVKKKAMEAIKALHPKLQQYDVPFKMNDDGSINTKVIADAMKRYKIEGIDEQQIQQAITAVMSPDDLNQLSISADYQFRDVTPEQLVERAKTNYSIKKESSKTTLEFLRKQRGLANNPNLVDKIDARIAYEEKLLGKDGVSGLLDEQLKENVELAINNPDAVKTSLYKDGFVKEFANAFSWKNDIVTYEKNPIREQLNWVADMKFKQEQENRRRYEFSENLKREDQKISLQSEANALKKIELYGDPISTDWTPLGNPTDNKLRAQEYFTGHVSSVSSAIQSDMSKLQKKYTDGQINEMLDDWKKNGTKATKVKPDALVLIQNISKNDNYLKSLKNKEETLKNEAAKEATNDPKFVKKLNEMNVDLNNLDKSTGSAQLNLGLNQSVNLTPSKLIDDINSGKATLRVDKALVGKIRLTYYVDGVPKSIEINKSSIGVDVSGANKLRPILLGVNEHLNKYGSFSKDYNDDIDERYREKLAPLAQQFVPQIKAVATGKDGKLPPVIVSRLSQLLTSADVNDIAADKKFNLETASNMLLDKNIKDTRIFIYQDGDNYEVRMKSESDPENIQRMKLSKEDIIRYFGQGYVNDKTQESIRLNIGRGNTNITGDPLEAVFQKQFGNFPGINNFQVTADLNQDLSDPNLYTAMINVRRKDGGYTNFEIAGDNKLRRVGYEEGRKSLDQLTDATLLKLLKENYPNYDFSNLDY
jgi:hypothetical protein